MKFWLTRLLVFKHERISLKTFWGAEKGRLPTEKSILAFVLFSLYVEKDKTKTTTFEKLYHRACFKKALIFSQLLLEICVCQKVVCSKSKSTICRQKSPRKMDPQALENDDKLGKMLKDPAAAVS